MHRPTRASDRKHMLLLHLVPGTLEQRSRNVNRYVVRRLDRDHGAVRWIEARDLELAHDALLEVLPA